MEILQRNKKQNPKVDLTAMVDLGFLLITFFMLATTFSQSKAMQILQPDSNGEFPYPESKTATLVLGSKEWIYTYSLPDDVKDFTEILIDSVDYSPAGLRNYIQKRQREVEAQWGDKEKLFVIIKPLPGSLYKHLSDVLDEMLINDVKHYAIMEANTPIDSILALRVGEN